MTQQVHRILVGFATVALAIAGLSACAPATTPGTPGAVPTGPVPHPSATHRHPPALDTVAPAARLNVPCASLVTPAQLTEQVGPNAAEVTPAKIAAADLLLTGNMLNIDALPSSDYLRAAGAIDCLWANVPTQQYSSYPVSTDSSNDETYIQITVLFDAANAWSILEEGGASGNDDASCDAGPDGHSVCIDDHLLGGNTWVEITDETIATESDPNFFENFQTAVFAKITAAGAASTLPTPQAGTVSVGTQCSAFVSDATVQSALGSSAPTPSTTPVLWGGANVILGSIPIYEGASDELNDNPCVWQQGSTTVAQLAWIPGGAWAWKENRGQPLADAPLQTLSIAGLGQNDGAWVRCAPADTSCTADLILGGNWIEVALPAGPVGANKLAAIKTIAAAIVAKVG